MGMRDGEVIAQLGIKVELLRVGIANEPNCKFAITCVHVLLFKGLASPTLHVIPC
jgi:hypothetical protein